MAVACAAAFCVERLMFLTDVEGVRDGSGEVRPALTAGESRRLIEDGIATGGMRAKLESAAAALAAGVEQVCIAPGAAPGILGRILAGEPAGTRMLAGQEQPA
jgi:acetylglutamate kinase